MKNRKGAGLEDRLRELEDLAEFATIPGANAVYLNQAGDACIAAGEYERGLQYIGRAIDAHVKADRFVAAMALCKKALRLNPEVVRARCTLAWLSIGNGFEGDACTWVDGYVTAAEHAGREHLAVSQLRRMGEVAAGEELRVVVGERLLALGDELMSDHLLGMAYGERNGTAHPPHPDDEERWSTARRAVLLGPREFRD
jgi:tetratricopeptide (TPR) repeat protein